MLERSPASPIIEWLADYAVEMRSALLPADLAHHGKRAVIDWFAATLPGLDEPAPARLRAALAEELGHGRSIVYGAGKVGEGTRAPARVAALLNGTASHVTEFDDIFRDAIYHPGSPTIAAALACAHKTAASGADLLRATVVGYEIGTRIGTAVNPAHYRYWHTTGTVGTFAAAAAAACVLGADRQQFAHALGIAGSMAAGLQQAFRSDAMSKPLHAGHAADAGTMAALAATQGFTGALDILEGEAGFGRAMSDTPDWEAAFADLGERHNIAAVTVKNHGCCGHTFAAIDAALALQAAHGFAPADVAHLVVHTYSTALKVAGSPVAETPFQAKFSMAYVVATALLHGSVRLDAFTLARLADDQVRDLMGRIELAVDPAYDRGFPRQRAAWLEVTLRDGRILTHHQTTRRGDPDDPMSDAELDAKFLELAGARLGAGGARALLAELHALDRRQDCELLAP